MLIEFVDFLAQEVFNQKPSKNIYNYDLAEFTKSAGFQHPKLQELIPTRLKRVSWFTSCHAKIRSKADLPLPAVPASKTGALMASKRRKRSWKATWNQKHERWWCGCQPENRDQPKDFKAKLLICNDVQWSHFLYLRCFFNKWNRQVRLEFLRCTHNHLQIYVM